MKFSKLLQIKPSRIKTKLDIDKCLINKAKEKRKRKGERRLRERRHKEEVLWRKAGRVCNKRRLIDEARAFQDWPVEERSREGGGD